MTSHRRKSGRFSASRLSRSHGSTLTLILASAVTFALLAAVVVFFMFRGKGRDSQNGLLLHQVSRGTFVHDVVERGEIESSKNVEVRCLVKARGGAGAGSGYSTSILWVEEEGKHVKKGDVIVQLDASSLENEKIQQQILVNNAEWTRIQSDNFYHTALIAKKEYLQGTYKQEEQAIQSEVFVAEENLRRAKEYYRYSEVLAAKSYVTAVQLEGDRFAVAKREKELETSKTKLSVLQQFTKEKMIKQLESDIKIYASKWEADKQSYQLEQNKLIEIADQITKCAITAPRNGQLVYANVSSSRTSKEFIVEQGAMVRENQPIIRLPDPQEMQVNVKINESRISLLRVGMPAAIEIGAYSGGVLEGVVVKVNQYAESPNWYNASIKTYLTLVKIKNPPPEIRPGLNAKVRIHVSQLEGVLQVPVQAIHRHGWRFYCLVRQDDSWQAREVSIGASNDKFVIVNAQENGNGLDENEMISLSPRQFLDQVDLPEITPNPEQQIASVPRDRLSSLENSATASFSSLSKKSSIVNDHISSSNGKGQ